MVINKSITVPSDENIEPFQEESSFLRQEWKCAFKNNDPF